VGISPWSAVVGVAVIATGVAVGVGAAEVAKANSEKISEAVNRLWGKNSPSDGNDGSSNKQ